MARPFEMPAGYDVWKLATPPEYEWPSNICEDCQQRDCPRLHGGDACCDVCADTGWMVGPDDHVEPCCECSGEADEWGPDADPGPPRRPAERTVHDMSETRWTKGPPQKRAVLARARGDQPGGGHG